MQQRDGLIETAQRAERGDLARQPRPEPQHRARDDAERAFGADEQLLQIVTRVVLEHLVQRAQDGPVGEHGLETEHEVAHHAEADHLIAARVRRDVAADRARAARAEVEREEVARVGRGSLHGLQRRARAHGHRLRRAVDLLDTREALEGEGDLAFLRRRAAREPGEAALDHDALLRPVALAQDRGDVLGRRGLEHRERRARVLVAEVDAITRAGVRAREDLVRAEAGSQRVDDVVHAAILGTRCEH